MWGAHEGMGWWMVFGGISWVLFIGGMVYLTSTVTGRGNSSLPRESAMDIARRRYASGEISESEFEQIREKLTK